MPWSLRALGSTTSSPRVIAIATEHQENSDSRTDAAIDQVRKGLEALLAGHALYRIKMAMKDSVAAFLYVDSDPT
ncbi:hypothetical protein NCCP2495_34290 [Dietzia sp. NCCP-2495]|uniref:hypothetical protein n=1 Tax=Dietzia sp. NCCP-2495 TaxID=2934675 RepID=UPI00222EC798|nr:hypothetical protein [Dietzia sp. NCCP-2495]GLB65546.1 hypothetical protein NCCP2495_34290 [Dietzia sp. NCCP-2495]